MEGIHHHMKTTSDSSGHAIAAKMFEQKWCPFCPKPAATDKEPRERFWILRGLIMHERITHAARKTSTITGFTKLAREGLLEDEEFLQKVQEQIALHAASSIQDSPNFDDLMHGKDPKPADKLEQLQWIYTQCTLRNEGGPWYDPVPSENFLANVEYPPDISEERKNSISDEIGRLQDEYDTGLI